MEELCHEEGPGKRSLAARCDLSAQEDGAYDTRDECTLGNVMQWRLPGMRAGIPDYFSASLTAALIEAGNATIRVRLTAKSESEVQGAFRMVVRSIPTTISENR